MSNKWILASVAVVVVVLVGLFVLNTNSKPTQSPTPQPSISTASPSIEPNASASPSAMKNDITVVGTEFSFNPSQITVVKGEKTTLTFKNNGTTTHDLVIEGLGVSTKRIQPGQSDTVEFTPEKTGNFEFFCSVGNHADSGMVGSLTVK